MEITGKVAVVTGAGSGIGRATAFALAREGASVLVADIDPGGGKETVTAIEAEGGTADFVQVDVADVDQVAAMFDAAEQRFGGVDIVHNNAGIVCGEPLWPDTAPERLLQQVLVNFGSVVVGTRLAVDHLAQRGGGVIVNTASIAALLPMGDEPAYSGTKAGVVMFTRGCAGLRESHNIRVNAVLPGLVDTPLLNKSGDGTRRAGWAEMAASVLPMQQPEDVAGVVLELVRDDSAAGEHRIVGELPDVLKQML
jgi:NAD(P)-dependent dehydrogenase (short-subunit alcohol dehydrogenase family)